MFQLIRFIFNDSSISLSLENFFELMLWTEEKDNKEKCKMRCERKKKIMVDLREKIKIRRTERILNFFSTSNMILEKMFQSSKVKADKWKILKLKIKTKTYLKIFGAFDCNTLITDWIALHIGPLIKDHRQIRRQYLNRTGAGNTW